MHQVSQEHHPLSLEFISNKGTACGTAASVSFMGSDANTRYTFMHLSD